MAKQVSLTYGVLPSFEQFEEAFDRECPTGAFHFGNDERFGTDEIHITLLWSELETAVAEFEAGNDKSGDWASCVLTVLGFEWI